MIAAGVPLQCVALTTDTQFDTHSGQEPTFDSGVKLVADSLAAFQADLEARGVDGRVLVHVWSEFGRRAQENGSDGTDHGAAGASLLIGSRVNGGMIGEFAPLNELDVRTATSARTSISAASTARCWSSGSIRMPPPSSRVPAAFRATSCWHETPDHPVPGPLCHRAPGGRRRAGRARRRLPPTSSSTRRSGRCGRRGPRCPPAR